MTALRRVCVAGLLGAWLVVSSAQETAEEAEAESDAQLQTVAEDISTGAGDALNENGEEQAEAAAEAGATEAGAADAGQVIPEPAPLDELFIPSEDVPICYERNRSECEGRPFPVDI